MDTILIVDDNPQILSALSLLLDLHDYSVVTASNTEDALDLQLDYLHNQNPLKLVIQDMNFVPDATDGRDGRRLFYGLREQQPDLPIILMTAWANLSMAVELVKAGAADYINKPWEDDRLLTTIRNLIESAKNQQTSPQTQQAFRDDQTPLEERLTQHNLCGTLFSSPSMKRVVDTALQVAPADVPILISGPNGAGKEKIAEIVQANSQRADKPFIRVNAGALPDDLLEAELFGAEKGAYTGCTQTRIGRFEAADGGTLFLDEMGNLPLPGQQKLLRVLQTGEFERLGSSKTKKVDVRIISATNANLLKEIQCGNFREDLYYRLNVIELVLPPLCERSQDIPLLANHFLQQAPTTPTPHLMPDALNALVEHTWPGNVRELQNCLQRASLLCKENIITRDDLGLPIITKENSKVSPSATLNKTSAQSTSMTSTSPNIKATDFSLQEIQSALDECDGVVAHAAKSLGISRQAIYRRLKQNK